MLQPMLFLVLLWQRKGTVTGNTHRVNTTCAPLKGEGVVLQIGLAQARQDHYCQLGTPLL